MRLKEINSKIKFYRKIKTILPKINKIEKTLPEIPKEEKETILQETPKPQLSIKTKNPLDKIESELKELQDRLKSLQQ